MNKLKLFHYPIYTKYYTDSQWLEENPAGVRPPRYAVDNVVPMRHADERPKFGPGSGLGGRKREKTQEELVVHRGRQIANSEQKYWSQKLGKPVDKFSDEDFKRVVELFGNVRGDRKAAKKKQGGRNN